MAQTQGIANQRGRNVRIALEQQFQSLLPGLDVGHRGQVVQYPVDLEVDLFHVQPAGLDLGEIEDVVNDAEQRFGRAVDLAQVVLLLFREIGAQRQVAQADHGIHRRADLVAHVGQEITLRFCSDFSRLLGLEEFFLRFLPFGNVLDEG